MSEVLSTEDVPLQWADEVGDVHKKAGTQFFLFPHRSGHTQESGHLVITELERGVKGALEEPLSSVEEVSTQTKSNTMPTGRHEVRVPRAKRVTLQTDQRYILLKKYEGFVTARAEHSFVVRLYENLSDYPVVEAEFDLEEISETDRQLAVEGAPLVWTMGYRYDGSTRKRESAIYLRRLPAWTEKEVEQARKTTEELTRAIRWE